MKQSLLAFLLLLMQFSFAQDCTTRAAARPSASVRFPDIYTSAGSDEKKPASWDISRIKPHLAKTENWVKNLLTGFTGAKLAYSNNYFLDNYKFGGAAGSAFYKATGIKGCYSAKMRFYQYYCYPDNETIHTEAESGSFINVVFNNVFLTPLCTSVDLFTINGKPAFSIYEKTRSDGRIDNYDLRAKYTDDNIYTSHNEIFLIRNSDKPVFLTITRKEYLEQMLKDVGASKDQQQKMLDTMYHSNEKLFEAEMVAYKKDKNYTPEKEARRRTWFREDQEKLKRLSQKLDPDAEASIKTIRQYLQKPAEWLNRGFGSFYTSSYTAKGLEQYFEGLDVFKESNEDNTRTVIVSLNPDYFNKKLGIDVPQLIAVHLAKKRYPHMLKVTALHKKLGALAPLEALLNPGKSQQLVAESPEPASNYSLKFLPKLASLSRLNVPAGLKPSVSPVNYNTNPPAAKFNFDLPPLSSKLNNLPQLLTAENYKAYVLQLNAAISNAIQPEVKTNADAYVKSKTLADSKDLRNSALAAWLKNAPVASLYLYSKALLANPADALAANNFSAFLVMGGLPEKSIPILEYWNRQKPREATILSNLGNAYYRLGDVKKAMSYAQQCVQTDTLNATANKILCLLYLKKGNTEKAKDHGTKSVTRSHDEQVITILRELKSPSKAGEIMSRWPAPEFPMLKRIQLPALPSNLDDMEPFLVDLDAEKKSLEMTIAAIESKMPRVNEDVKQQLLMASMKSGIGPLRVKAQYIIMDGMQVYQQERIEENDVFKFHLKKLDADYSVKAKAISKKYNDQINKLESGEGGDDDLIDALELAKCKELNVEKAKYLAAVSVLFNGYAQRQEFISRKFYRDYANWAPLWMPQTTISFPEIERSYLKDLLGILSEYPIITKNNCTPFEPLEKKEARLKKWEDEYCANFKGKIAIGPAAITWTCTSWGIEGGEGILGEAEVNYTEDGEFDNFILGGGLGESWSLSGVGIADIEAGVSIKEFIKIGKDKATGKWEVQDFGLKTDATLEANIGNVAREIKLVELSVSVNAGLNADGIVVPLMRF